jgi:hypothetical protein
MFALPVAKPKSVPPQPLAATAHRPDQAAVAHRQLSQETIGNQATLRRMAKRASVTRNAPHAHENQDKLTDIPSREAAQSWDFSKVPLYPSIFPQLAINEPGDAYEAEAERVADHVMNFPSPESPPLRISAAIGSSPQRRCTSCEEEEGKLDHKETSTGPSAAPPIVHEVLRSAGQPLDPATRAFMEKRFGHDFGKVRVHTDQRAASSASAIHALAYTSGESIIFGAGQHSPNTASGRHLLAHELTHIVQQVQRPAGVIYRQATSQDEADKVTAVKDHTDQQQRVVQFLSNALKIKPDPAKGPLDPDNLYHNTAELVDPAQTAKAVLKVLTPTHYSNPNKPTYFDNRVSHPQIKGDYPADPHKQDAGLAHPPTPGTYGQTEALPSQSTGLSTSSTPKVEYAPARVDPTYTGKERAQPQPEATQPAKTKTPAKPTTPPVIAWSAAEVKLFIERAAITEAEFKNVFAHEGQHVADWIYLKDTKQIKWENLLEVYKSEFRAFWIQPPVLRTCATCAAPLEGPFPDPNSIPKLEKQNTVTLPSGQSCAACGDSSTPAKGTATSPTSQVTTMKNDRQKSIFWSLLSKYPADHFDCFYVCNKNFRDAVDAYDSPAGSNLANSTRLIDLNIEVQKLNPAMTRAEVGQTNFQSAIEHLDAVDWTFLKDAKLSAPFWNSVKGFAPPPIYEAFHALAKKASPSAKDISQGLGKALAKLKAP